MAEFVGRRSAADDREVAGRLLREPAYEEAARKAADRILARCRRDGGAGALTARFTARTWLFSGVRQLLLGAFAAAVTYGVGQLFDTIIS